MGEREKGRKGEWVNRRLGEPLCLDDLVAIKN
jgi:hypothetical protein